MIKNAILQHYFPLEEENFQGLKFSISPEIQIK